MYPLILITHKYSENLNKILTLQGNICKYDTEVAKKRKNTLSGVDPEYLKKQKEALTRRHRQVIYLNDSEMAAINLYCDKFKVGTKAVLFRKAIMEKILSELDDNHPTLF
jgi:hypothetical protein